jgi:hypothetical protein
MKTTISTDQPKKEGPVASKPASKKKELKTDLPLSEKDEVKQAEERTKSSAKKKI